MIVRYWMTSPAVTVKEDDSLMVAFETMKSRGIRRVMVEREGELCGVLSISDLYRYVEPIALTTLDELPVTTQESLSLRRVAHSMTPSPSTCDLNDHLEDVAEVMRKEKIGSMPVLRDGKLIGVITESDVLVAITRLARYESRGTRVCVKVPVEDRQDVVYKVFDMCKAAKVDLLTVLRHRLQDEECELILLRVDGENTESFVSALWDSHFQVLTAG